MIRGKSLKFSLDRWPKKSPPLSEAQERAREGWMKYWHEVLPNRFGVIEQFNHGFPAQMHLKNSRNQKVRTLEVGAGLGEHVSWENLKNQEYYLFEYRKDWCDFLRQKYPHLNVVHGDIQKKTPFEDHFFDRIIAIHVLEHLPDLPRALDEVARILRPEGVLDIVLPCEGGWAYELARKLSSERMFKKKFKMEYRPIIKSEHVNTLPEILFALREKGWQVERSKYFPLKIPLWSFNLCLGGRLKRNKG
ncbi:MAG: class I SAM-dependent methyltransferase [Bdellovibrio sp.]|nr:MAG: class I SAM-dependent methyltransferase [Bdellovibrio sp.]